MSLLLSGNSVKFSREDMRRLNALKALTNAPSFEAVVGAALDRYEALVLNQSDGRPDGDKDQAN
jgi:hypothetical protein